MKSRRLCRIFGSNWTMLGVVLSFNETRKSKTTTDRRGQRIKNADSWSQSVHQSDSFR